MDSYETLSINWTRHEGGAAVERERAFDGEGAWGRLGSLDRFLYAFQAEWIASVRRSWLLLVLCRCCPCPSASNAGASTALTLYSPPCVRRRSHYLMT